MNDCTCSIGAIPCLTCLTYSDGARMCTCVAGRRNKNCGATDGTVSNCRVFTHNGLCLQQCTTANGLEILDCQDSLCNLASVSPTCGQSTCLAGSSMMRVLNDTQAMKRLEELMEGDKVMTVSDQMNVEYNKFLFHAHANPDVKIHMVEVKTEAGNVLRLTHRHLMYVYPESNMAEGHAIRAEDVKAGDSVMTVDDDNTMVPQKVVEVGVAEVKGIYGPIVKTGVVIADNILVSNYVDAFGKEVLNLDTQVFLSHQAMWCMRMAKQIIPGVSNVFEGGSNGMPQGVEWMMNAFLRYNVFNHLLQASQ